MRLLVALILVGLAAPAVQACSCAGDWTPERSFESADVVFVGTAIDGGPTGLYVDPWEELEATTFEIDEVLKGLGANAGYKPERPRQVSIGSGGPCGPSFEVGAQYVVFAWQTYSQLAGTDSCAWNFRTAREPARLAAIRRLAREGATPSAPPPPPAPGDARGRGHAEAAEAMRAEEAPPQFRMALWLSGGLNVLLGVVAVTLWTRSRARAS